MAEIELAVVVAVAIPIVGFSIDAWRRSTRTEDDVERIESKLDVLLASLGIDPQDPPEYPLRDIRRRPDRSESRSEDAQEDPLRP